MLKQKLDHNCFKDLAEYLLEEVIIKVKDKKYRICEIEFYYYSDDHLDEYVHKDKDQLENGKIYFHKKGGNYKSGTFKGMDLVLSQGKDNYFGILIRAIYDIDEDNFISGPCNSVNEILNILGYDNVKSYMESRKHKLVDFHGKDDITVCEYELESEDIYVGSRIGLNKDKNEDFFDKKYRYVTMINQVKKEKRKLKRVVRYE